MPNLRPMIRLVLAALLLILTSGATAGPAALPWRFRTLEVRVVDEAGHRAAGVEVALLGLERDAISASRESAEQEKTAKEKYQGWSFTTGRDGSFTARFGQFRQYDYEEATGKLVPGYGEFYFVAEKKGSAGAVSPLISNQPKEEAKRSEAQWSRRDGGEGEEWRHDRYRPYVLQNQPAEKKEALVLEMRGGLRIAGQLTDSAGHPLAGVMLELWHDLHADTHTGRGGEIFWKQETTDSAGRFAFQHVFPNTFYLGLGEGSEEALYWTRTRVRHRWVEGRADEITPEFGEDSISLLLIATRQSPYHYQGRVRDTAGHPLAGARVSVHASLHSPERTFEDGHNYYSETRTKEDGSYDLGADSPFVRSFRVEAAGFQDRWEYGEDDDLYAPGEYNFQLERK